MTHRQPNASQTDFAVKTGPSISGYTFKSASPSPAHTFLLPTVRSELEAVRESLRNSEPRLFDLGCGNGSVGAVLHGDGWSVTGVDPSEAGVNEARKAYPSLAIEQCSAYEDLAARFGRYPAVVSLEVVEHLHAPRAWARAVFDLLEPGGTAVLPTPYHGYWKNLALAVTGKMDEHFKVLRDHGHIKFWSIATLTTLLHEAGLSTPRFIHVERVPALARSMIAVVHKPTCFRSDRFTRVHHERARN